ncbi:MAG TPA: AtpZ/AtpI family protein [Gemmatimonadaceae bacterium]|nr:AtpZ/AtpI family protein [Gemmatimonadaceae bacterium]
MSPSSFAGHGFQLVISILLFLYLGKWVDGKLGTAPAFLIVGVFLGAAAGFYSMIRALTAHQRDDRDDREDGGSTNR